MTTLRERFEAKYIPEPNSGCWLWDAAVNQSGYGHMDAGGKVFKQAHRISYELHTGPIGEGLVVCHRCDVPACVNPDHLFVGTVGDNMRDMAKKGRRATTPGEKQPRARLTDADAIAMRQAHINGALQKDLATRFRVSAATVWYVVSGRGWRHV